MTQTVFKIRNKKTGEWKMAGWGWSKTNGFVFHRMQDVRRHLATNHEYQDMRYGSVCKSDVELVEFEMTEIKASQARIA